MAYLNIAGGYKYAALRVGLVVMNPQGREVYFQPGDDESAIRDTIDAIGEVPENRQADVADMCLGDYFD